MRRSPEPVTVAILVAVGPGAAEAARTVDLVDSLVTFEPTTAMKVVILDDCHEDRNLAAKLVPIAGDRIVVLKHMRRLDSHDVELPKTTLGPLCAGLLQALDWMVANLSGEHLKLVLKLDTDALVIGPFAKQIERILASDPEIGLLGACRKTPNGSLRDIGHHEAIMRELHLPTVRLRRPQTLVRYMLARLGLMGPARGIPARVSRDIGRARRHGYVYGEHCLGGAYALSADFVRRLHHAGHLNDPAKWMSTHCGEDIMLSMYTHAVGLKMEDAVGRGEPFGIRYQGLPWTPEQLLERGYSLIHSVKNDVNFDEEQIRAFFQAQRRSLAAPAANDPAIAAVG